MNADLLSLAIWVPIVAGLLVLAAGGERNAPAQRWIALIGALLGFAVTIPLYTGFDLHNPGMQFVQNIPWIERFHVSYHLGVDGISVLFVLLNSFITILVVIAGWSVVQSRVSQYYASFLILSGLMNGVFAALDGVLFYVFFEAMLVPMYFIISVWGGPRRKYAAIKFFMYTFLASLPLLLSIFAFYFYSGTFDITPITATSPIPVGIIGDLMFVAMVVAFGTKLPTFPLHTWLPDAHVEAPTGGSVILAGILLKLGGYGLIRFNVQMIPQAAADMWWVLAALGIVSILYGAIVCLAQNDLKRMLAYSTIAQIGFMLLGLMSGMVNGNGMSASVAYGAAAFYMGIYVLSTLGTFGVIMFMAHQGFEAEELRDFAGLGRSHPWLAGIMAFLMFSLAGVPPFAGFYAKFEVLAVLLATGRVWLVVAAVMLSLIALVWWARPPFVARRGREDPRGAVRPGVRGRRRPGRRAGLGLRVHEFGRVDLVHDEAGHLETEGVEHGERARRVQDGHALRDQDHEERRAVLVHHEVREARDLGLDVVQLPEDLVLGDLPALQGRGDRLVLLGLLPGLRDLAHPLAQDRRHRDHPDAVAERRHVEHVEVVVARRHEVRHGVVRRGLVHRGLRRGGVDVLLDLPGELREAVHGQDLLLHLVLVVRDALVRVDLHDVQVGLDLDRALPEDVPVEDVAQAGLGIRGEAEDPLPALGGHVVGEARGTRRLPEAPLAREDHDALVAALLEEGLQTHADRLRTRCP